MLESNYTDSFNCKETWIKVSLDIIEAHKLVGMPLKPGYTTLETDPSVIETSGLTSADPTTMLLGSI